MVAASPDGFPDGTIPQLPGAEDVVVWARSKEDGGLLFCSPQFFEWTGTSHETLSEDRDAWLAAVHPDDRPRLREASEQLATEALVWRLNRPDGQQRWLRTRVLDIESTRTLGFWIGLAEDISDEVARQQLATRSRQAEDDLRALLADPTLDRPETVAAAAERVIERAVAAAVQVRLDPAADPSAMAVHGPDGATVAWVVADLDPQQANAVQRMLPVLGHVLSTARLHHAEGHASRVIESLLAGESVIGEVAATLADAGPRDLDEAVTMSLGRLGELVGADRAYLFQFLPLGRLSNTHEWCAEGIEPAIELLQDLDAEEFAWITEMLDSGEPLFIDVESLGPDAQAEREILQAQDIKTLALVPMQERGVLRGFVGFDAVRAARQWGDYEASLLRWFVRLIHISLSRAQVQQRLADSQRRFRDFAEQARENLFWFVPEQVGGAYSNAAFEQVFGQPLAAWHEDHWSTVLRAAHPEDRAALAAFSAPFRHARAGEPPDPAIRGSSSAQFRVRHPDGTVRWVEARLFPIVDDVGALVHVGGFAEDITARKDLELGLVEARDAAVRASAAKSDFIFKSSHELRTPLNAVQGFSFLARRAGDEAERERYLDRLEEAVGSLAGIVEDLLTLGRAEAGSRGAEAGPVRLQPLLTDAVALLEPSARAARISIAVDVPDVVVAGDAETYDHVFRNLLDNAVKYNRPEGSVSVSASLADDHVLVVVADTGRGIAASRIDRIWEPFERADVSGTAGSGLGLAIVRALVERLDGHIEVESVEGLGSTFTVRLPRWHRDGPADAGDGPSSTASALVAAAASDGRDLLAAVVGHAGFDQVHRADSAAAAERALRDQRPAFAALELDLGDGYATDVLRAIERSGRRIPVVVLAPAADPDVERRCREAGASAFLTTPLDVPALAALAASALADPDR